MALSYTEKWYEIAWGERENLIDQYIEEEGANPYRIIKKFENFERVHALQLDQLESKDENGEITEKRLTGDSNWVKRTEKFLYDVDYFPVRVPVVDAMEVRQAPIYVNYDDAVSNIIANTATQDLDAIVELGSGYGRNVFLSYYNGGPRDVRYIAAEFTESGQRIAEKLAALDPDVNFESVFFDHKNPDFSFLGDAKNILMFTSHSIEQVHLLPNDYFLHLAQAAPSVLCFHFEPFGFHALPENELAKAQTVYIQEHGYNQNFYPLFLKAGKLNRIRIRKIVPFLYSMHVENPTSVAIWDNLVPDEGPPKQPPSP